MAIGNSELAEIQLKWQNRLTDYEDLSDYIRERCFGFRKQNPTIVRIILSREPKVKTLFSITQKIEACRKSPETPSFKYEDLNDIVALTVLCPYASDAKQFISWMHSAFRVLTPDKVAYREYESGHRGYHYVITPTVAELVNQPRFNRIKCELQIKTLLQEAFDAKSHDLAYKPGHLNVGPDLQTQFTLLSAALNAIDGQSEFLKSLILREQRELELRRNACLKLYLRSDGDMREKVGLDPDQLPDVLIVAQRLKECTALLSADFCKFAAFCALKLDHALLKDTAIEFADQWIGEEPANAKRVFVRGAINWALGRFEDSFNDYADVIDRSANGKTADHPDLGKRAKNNLVYAVCDCKLFKHDVAGHWVETIAPYLEELRVDQTGNEADTIGLYQILFSNDPEGIEEGRSLLRISIKNRSDEMDAEIYNRFFELHEYVALTRLLDLARSRVSY